MTPHAKAAQTALIGRLSGFCAAVDIFIGLMPSRACMTVYGRFTAIFGPGIARSITPERRAVRRQSNN